MRNLIIGQSGGPTSVINGSLYGVVKEAIKSGKFDNILGAIYGINGIIKENFIDFINDNVNLELLKATPAAYLGSVRFKLSDDFSDPSYEKILSIFKKYCITDFYYIGGNDSMDTCLKLDKYFKSINYHVSVIGIPKTIDNDLACTDHSPGYASAAKFIINSIINIYQDINVYEKGRVTIVEIMGRDAGWLTAAVKLAETVNCKADLIYLPETPFDQDKFISDVKRIYARKRKVLVCVSEGIKNKMGDYVLSIRKFNANDKFGHLQLGGVAQVLAELIGTELQLPVRAIELNLLQRCFFGSASQTDLNEAIMCGKYAVRYALQNKSGVMITMNRVKGDNYKIKYSTTKLNDVAGIVRYFPKEWIKDDNQIQNEFINYLRPMIKGNVKINEQNDLPLYIKR